MNLFLRLFSKDGKASKKQKTEEEDEESEEMEDSEDDYRYRVLKNIDIGLLMTFAEFSVRPGWLPISDIQCVFEQVIWFVESSQV